MLNDDISASDRLNGLELISGFVQHRSTTFNMFNALLEQRIQVNLRELKIPYRTIPPFPQGNVQGQDSTPIHSNNEYLHCRGATLLRTSKSYK